MSTIDLLNWVNAETDPSRRYFRQASHLVLRAIANSHRLAPLMVMKGGTLLAIRYNSPRFTKDIDFSTTTRFAEDEVPRFLEDLADALIETNADNEYGLMLKVQSHTLKPKAEKTPTFPTLHVNVGYAKLTDSTQIRQLKNNNASNTVAIDYSYNEWASSIEQQSLDGGTLSMYPLDDLIAEKYRAVLQQAERNRKRFQDIYDLCLLIEGHAFNIVKRADIQRKLLAACARSEIVPKQTALRDENLIRLSREDYDKLLPTLLLDSPPKFDDAFNIAREFYESLPW